MKYSEILQFHLQNHVTAILYKIQFTYFLIQNYGIQYAHTVKAVVAGPLGRRAPDHFFGRVCFPPCPFFLVLAHFSLCLPLIFNLLMQSSITLVARVIHRPTSQGVKTLKNNAIIIITVIILMGRVERKPDVVAFED